MLVLTKLNYDITKGKQISMRSVDSNIMLWKKAERLISAFNSEYGEFLGNFKYKNVDMKQEAQNRA
jgi:hypothetical protein